jgi:hypothetical protein
MISRHTSDSSPPPIRAPEAPPALRAPARRVESAVMVAGASAVALGAVAEWAAPLWTALPPSVHPLLAANESLVLVGGASFLLAALLRRARRPSRTP